MASVERGFSEISIAHSCREDASTRPYHSIQVGRDVFAVDKRYINLKPIGGGSYGIVCSAEDTITRQKVAIKKITDAFNDLVDAKRILREIKLLRHVEGHENVIKILDIMTFPYGTLDFDDIYIVTDLMESDLDRIISSSQPLSEQHFQYFLYQVLRGLKFIHSANVLHRDIKPSNLLVNANCDLAICDFGLARGIDAGSQELTEYVVTRWYRAPELLTECQSYDAAVDVWALGCIFAEMLCRRPFFQGRDPTHQLYVIINMLGTPTEHELAFITNKVAKQAIRELPYREKGKLRKSFRKASVGAVDLLSRMLVFNPKERITVDEALNHPYLKQLHNQCDEPTCGSAFDFAFEKWALESGEDIPKAELQELIYRELTYFRPSAACKLPQDTKPSFEGCKAAVQRFFFK